MIIGRKKELKALKSICESESAQFVALYGRRRIGKTYLITEYFNGRSALFFQVTGIKKGSMKKQLDLFRLALQKTFFNDATIPELKSWKEAFNQLHACVLSMSKLKKGNIVVFLDELPWLATKKSDLLAELDQSWNTQLSKIKSLKLFICGSAASWIINKIVSDKGGLHNRLTERIHLKPFTLAEAHQFLHSQHVLFNRQQTLECYLVFGGVPYYLSRLKPNESIPQAISRLCFADGPLTSEYENLFSSLYDDSDLHYKIVGALSKRQSGVTRAELLHDLKITDGGTVSKAIDELTHAGFIERFEFYDGKARDLRLRIVDAFVLFHLKWIKPNTRGALSKVSDPKIWLKLSQKPAFLVWQGYAFENLCYAHIPQIRKALGIEDILSTVGIWNVTPSKETRGCQIDLIFDRDDKFVTLCEMKFSDKPFLVTEGFVENFSAKQKCFEEHFKPKKAVTRAIITPNGIAGEKSKLRTLHNVVEAEDLFQE